VHRGAKHRFIKLLNRTVSTISEGFPKSTQIERLTSINRMTIGNTSVSPTTAEAMNDKGSEPIDAILSEQHRERSRKHIYNDQIKVIYVYMVILYTLTIKLK
jgi:hypothetical protein